MLAILNKYYKKYKEVINYLIFGVLTTIISLFVYYILTITILNPNKPIGLQIANILSWIVGVGFAYVTNRKYVFESKNKNMTKELISFIGARIITLILDMLIMFVGVTLLKYNDKVLKIISQVLVIISNYLFSKIFVFSKDGGVFMKKILCFILNNFFGLFKIQNKIVFETGRGMVDGNPKAVYDYLVENNIDKFRLIWLVEKNTDVSFVREGDYVYYKTLKNYYHLATAKYWIRSQSVGSLIKKRKGQVYLQLWHGNGAMKKMGYDIANNKERPELEHVKEWDYYIANDQLDAGKIVSSTGYNGKIEILGMACLDKTLKLSIAPSFKQMILEKVRISKKDEKKKIFLYAPTFRDFDLEKDVIDVPIKKLASLKDKIFLVRLHPLVRKKINLTLFDNKNIINVCDYPDVSDLLAICDVLITDYSSIFFQFSPLNRPIVFYSYDFEKYVELRGGFYLDYKNDLPGPICYQEKELVKIIDNIDEVHKKYMDKQDDFNKKYNYWADGYSSKRFVDKLINNEFDSSR